MRLRTHPTPRPRVEFVGDEWSCAIRKQWTGRRQDNPVGLCKHVARYPVDANVERPHLMTTEVTPRIQLG